MTSRALPVAVALLAAALAGAAGGPSRAEHEGAVALSRTGGGPPVVATAAKRRRPTDAPSGSRLEGSTPTDLELFHDYSAPARAYSSRRAVVHYVVRGPDAPPLNDDDDSGVPDYVERVGDAADRSLDWFESRGFRAVRPDAGGPDARPDLYVARFVPGTFGVAFPAARAEGGAFAAVSNALDPGRTATLASLVGTVAHELFHLVQFSYFPAARDPELPAWVLEGTAAAVERRLYPELDDIVWALQLRRWFAAPHAGMAAQSYGAQLLWSALDSGQPRLLPAVLTAFGRSSGADADGIATVARAHAVVAREPLAAAFHRFALRIADQHADRLSPAGTVVRGARREASVAPLAVHYLRVRGSARAVTVRLGRGLRASLAYQVESDVAGNPSAPRRVTPRVAGGGRTLTFPLGGLRAGTRIANVTLVVSNGGAAARRYAVRAP